MDTVGTIYNRLTSVLYCYAVSIDKTLDYINRAQDLLNRNIVGDLLTTTIKLTLVNNSVALPSDLLRIINIEQDRNLDGVLDRYLALGSDYTLSETYSQITGKTTTLNIVNVNCQSLDTYLMYVKKLSDFPTENYSALFSYYDSELIIAAANYLLLQDSGLSGNEFSIAERRYRECLLRYKAEKCWTGGFNNFPRTMDSSGNVILSDNFLLNGEGSSRADSEDHSDIN